MFLFTETNCNVVAVAAGAEAVVAPPRERRVEVPVVCDVGAALLT